MNLNNKEYIKIKEHFILNNKRYHMIIAFPKDVEDDVIPIKIKQRGRLLFYRFYDSYFSKDKGYNFKHIAESAIEDFARQLEWCHVVQSVKTACKREGEIKNANG